MSANPLPDYEIGFVLLHLFNRSLTSEQALSASQYFRTVAQCSLKCIGDSTQLNEKVDTFTTRHDRYFSIQLTNSLLEAADMLEKYSVKGALQ